MVCGARDCSGLLRCRPCPIVTQWVKPSIARAILATQCDPAVFALLRYADVTIYDASGAGKYRGSCAAVAAPSLAFAMGYREVTFFGCEGSYASCSHAYRHEDLAEQMMVLCGGAEYRTRPDSTPRRASGGCHPGVSGVLPRSERRAAARAHRARRRT